LLSAREADIVDTPAAAARSAKVGVVRLTEYSQSLLEQQSVQEKAHLTLPLSRIFHWET
jgi:hypothetical protein